MKHIKLNEKIKDFNNSLKSVEIFLKKTTQLIKVNNIFKNIKKL